METITTTKWSIDQAHSEIAFKVKHMMISTLTGHFEDFTASVESSEDNFKNGKFEFEAKIDSINTKNNDRDNHLKSADFFDSAAFPTMKFTSTSFDGETLVGELTIKGETKTITLDVDFNGVAIDPYGQTKAGFEIKGEINRKDFGLTWSAVTEAGNIVVSDKIKLAVEVQFVKQ